MQFGAVYFEMYIGTQPSHIAFRILQFCSCLFVSFFFFLSLFSFFLSGPHMALNSDLFQGPLFAMSCVRSLGHDFLVMWSEVKASIMPLVLGLSAVVV
jgi:hypothetical protein